MTEPPRKKMVRAPTRGSDEPRAKPARLKTAKQRTIWCDHSAPMFATAAAPPTS